MLSSNNHKKNIILTTASNYKNVIASSFHLQRPNIGNIKLVPTNGSKSSGSFSNIIQKNSASEVSKTVVHRSGKMVPEKIYGEGGSSSFLPKKSFDIINQVSDFSVNPLTVKRAPKVKSIIVNSNHIRNKSEGKLGSLVGDILDKKSKPKPVNIRPPSGNNSIKENAEEE